MTTTSGGSVRPVAGEPSVLIRPASADDVDAIRRVGAITWPATYTFASADYIERSLATWWSDEALRRSIAETDVLVAVTEGEVVAVGNRDDSGPVPVIWKLYVLPDRHGSGIGTALLEALIDRVPSGVDAVRLEYLDGNDEAAGFYAARGFTECRREPGERDGWPGAVWLERRLPAR